MAANDDDLFYHLSDGREINFSEHMRKIIEQELLKSESRIFARVVTWMDEANVIATTQGRLSDHGVSQVIETIEMQSKLG